MIKSLSAVTKLPAYLSQLSPGTHIGACFEDSPEVPDLCFHHFGAEAAFPGGNRFP